MTIVPDGFKNLNEMTSKEWNSVLGKAAVEKKGILGMKGNVVAFFEDQKTAKDAGFDQMPLSKICDCTMKIFQEGSVWKGSIETVNKILANIKEIRKLPQYDILSGGFNVEVEDKERSSIELFKKENEIFEKMLLSMDGLDQTILNSHLINDLKTGSSLREIEKLIKFGASIDSCDEQGNTALILALGNEKLFDELLEMGADIFIKNNNNQNVLDLAMNRIDGEKYIAKVTKKLESLKEKPEIKNVLIDGMFAAIQGGNDKLAQLFLNLGVNINARDREGNTPLLVAVMSGNVDSIKWLIKAGANLDIQNTNEMNAVFLAQQFGRPDIYNLLLENGAMDEKGRTSLIRAIAKRDIDAVRTLIAKKVDINAADISGKTPLIYAAMLGNIEAVKELLQNGVNITLGETTAFFWSIVGEREDVIEYFLGPLYPVANQVLLTMSFNDFTTFSPKFMSSLFEALPQEEKGRILLLPFLCQDVELLQAIFALGLTKEQFEQGIKLLSEQYPDQPVHWLSEARFEVHQAHYEKVAVKEVVPPITEEVDVEKELINIIEGWNTEDPSKPNFIDPKTRLMLNKAPISIMTMKGNIQSFMKIIKGRERIDGMPPHGSDALKKYFDDIENWLKHIILKLNEKPIDIDLQVPTLLDLAGIIGHCGDKYLLDVRDLYSIIKEKKVGEKTFVDDIEETLQGYRRSALDTIVDHQLGPDGERINKGNRPHIENHYLYLIGKDYGIPGFSSAYKEDELYEPKFITKDSAVSIYGRHYNPTTIIDQVLQMKHESLNQWFKDNCGEWGMKTYAEKADEIQEKYHKKLTDLQLMEDPVVNKELHEARHKIFARWGVTPIKDLGNVEDINKAIIELKSRYLKRGMQEVDIQKYVDSMKKDFNSVKDRAAFTVRELMLFFSNEGVDGVSDPENPKIVEKAIQTSMELARGQEYLEKVVYDENGQIKREAIIDMLVKLKILMPAF